MNRLFIELDRMPFIIFHFREEASCVCNCGLQIQLHNCNGSRRDFVKESRRFRSATNSDQFSIVNRGAQSQMSDGGRGHMLDRSGYPAGRGTIPFAASNYPTDRPTDPLAFVRLSKCSCSINICVPEHFNFLQGESLVKYHYFFFF